MAEENLFSRKLSGEEAQRRFIIVPKEDLEFFPKPGKPFKLMIEGQTIDVDLRPHEVRRACTRKGALEHRLDLSKHFALYNPRFGETVIIEKKDDHYFLRIA